MTNISGRVIVVGVETSRTGGRVDASLARGYARQALRENRIRTSYDPGMLRGSIETLAGRKAVIGQATARFDASLIGAVTNVRRTRAALGFHDAGRFVTGIEAPLIMLCQLDMHLDPQRRGADGRKLGFEAASRVVAVAVPHLLERFVMRAGLKAHDDLVAAVRPALGWALIASYVGRPGSFAVPLADGMIGCEWRDKASRTTDGRLVGTTFVKTFIGTERMKPETAATRERLIEAGALDLVPRFPRISAFGDEEVACFERMLAIGAEWRARQASRLARRSSPDPDMA